jgi:hypothetical protein
LTNTRPTFAEVPSSPEIIGREASDQASEARATPVGHMPPTPMPARNRSSRTCSGVAAKYPTSEKMEKQKMLAPIARTRPARSPSQPNKNPPAAAPSRKPALYHENQSPRRASHVRLIGSGSGNCTRQARCDQQTIEPEDRAGGKLALADE